MLNFRRTGYQSNSVGADVALGTLDGLVSTMWAYAFATIMFTGALSVFVPVGLFVVLLGWAAASLLVITTSKLKTHMVTIDEQAVVVIGGVGSILALEMGEKAATSTGLATMLAIMALTSFIVSIAFITIGKLRLNRVLELMPYPVVCGFMAGIAWLILDAGYAIATDQSLSFNILHDLQQGQNALKLVLCLGCGVALFWFANRFDTAWTLPAVSALIVIVFYVVTWTMGISAQTLIQTGWLFGVQDTDTSVVGTLMELSFSDVDLAFVITALPKVFTIAFLLMLSAVMALSVVSSVKLDAQMDASDELVNMGKGNFLCGLVGSPPGYTDEVSSVMYEEFGASSRWMPIASSLTLLVIAFAGMSALGFMPKVLVGATVFLFAIEMIREWMYANVRKLGMIDLLIAGIILVVVIVFGFVEGILIGAFLAGFMFIFRYSRISAIQNDYTLADHRSSVERSASSNITLSEHGSEVMAYDLRGYLFFGTANAVRDTIFECVDESAPSAILLDLRRVTGFDISAMQIFQQIKNFCEGKDIVLMYSNPPEITRERLMEPDAVSYENDAPLVFDSEDEAIEYIEASLLTKYADKVEKGTVLHHLTYLMRDEQKAGEIASRMQVVRCAQGEHLFRQGEDGSGFFMVEAGTLSAMIDVGAGNSLRVKKFSPGSLIGELSLYMVEKKRTASVIADTNSILHFLDPDDLDPNNAADKEILLAIHEMVARTLAGRVDYMNRRLLKEVQ